MKKASIQLQAQLGKAHFEHEVNRIESQIQFARSLCELVPAQAGKWLPLVDRASDLAAEAAATGDVSTLREAVRKAEGVLAPLGKTAKSYSIQLAGHAHIDMNWMWSWPETVALTVDTFSTMLKLMEEYPDFHFSQSQASVYAIMEKYRPDLLAKIAERVREGRWEVLASHWVEGDKNIAGAESLCRHLLYTRRYMKRLFDLDPENVPIDWSPDTFGHAATVPGYLSQGGVRYLYMHRPGDSEVAKMWMFWWEGPDGSRVLVRNDSSSSGAYNGEVRGPVLARDSATFFKQTGLKEHLFIYGVGDHGGGPTRRDILQAVDMQEWPVFPSINFGTVTGYMKSVEKAAATLPVITRELNFEFTGCYTTQTLVKKSNRLAENRLADAEMAATLAWGMTGLPYPSASLEEGWRDTLFNHFHDILPGSGVHDTRTYTHGLFQKTAAAAAQIETQALRELARRVDTSKVPGELAVIPSSALCNGLGAGVGFQSGIGGMAASDQTSGSGPRPFVVFNPLLDDRDEIVEATIWDNAPQAGQSPMRRGTFVAIGPDGARLPAQVVDSANYWRHEYVTLAFRASVKGGGYALYTIVEETDEKVVPEMRPDQRAVLTEPRHHCPYSIRERAPVGLENEFLAVAINPVTGGILRLTDKVSGLDLVTPENEAPALEYAVERAHAMSAWIIQHAGVAPQVPLLRDLRRKQTGPLKASVEADLRIEQSDMTVAYELQAGDPKLHIRITGVWFQRGNKDIGVPVLSFALPMALENVACRYEIPFGAVDRNLTHGQEVPALQWAQATGTPEGEADRSNRAGLLLLNDSKHGHSLTGNVLRLTLIRSSYEPDILPEIGQHEIKLAIQPFAGDLPVPQAIRAGQGFNRALKVVGTDVHTGTWPADDVFVRQDNAAIQVCGVKKTEDGEGLIVRVFNPTAKKADARLALHADLARRVSGVERVDLMERPSSGKVAWKGNAAQVAVPPFAVLTVLFRFKD
jgi:alpha-mannosidase